MLLLWPSSEIALFSGKCLEFLIELGGLSTTLRHVRKYKEYKKNVAYRRIQKFLNTIYAKPFKWKNYEVKNQHKFIGIHFIFDSFIISSLSLSLALKAKKKVL